MPRDSTTPANRLPDAELAQLALQKSGVSAHMFARKILGRDERTERRWRTGEIPIPDYARDFLEHFVAMSDTERARVVRSLVHPLHKADV